MKYTNSQIEHLIDECIHVSWQREACKMKLIDGLTYEQIAEIFNYSTQYTKEVISKHKKMLKNFL